MVGNVMSKYPLMADSTLKLRVTDNGRDGPGFSWVQERERERDDEISTRHVHRDASCFFHRTTVQDKKRWFQSWRNENHLTNSQRRCNTHWKLVREAGR